MRNSRIAISFEPGAPELLPDLLPYVPHPETRKHPTNRAIAKMDIFAFIGSSSGQVVVVEWGGSRASQTGGDDHCYRRFRLRH